MKENNESSGGYEGQGIRAALWSVFGVGTAAAAKYVLGGEGGLFGGNGTGSCRCPATQRDLEYERKLTEANAELGQVKAEKYADSVTLAAERRLADKIEKLETSMNTATMAQAVFNERQNGVLAVLASQVRTLDGMTSLYIKQPVMAASEAALNTLTGKATTAAAGTGQ